VCVCVILPSWSVANIDLHITSVSECEMVVDGQSGPVLEPASESTASEG